MSKIIICDICRDKLKEKDLEEDEQDFDFYGDEKHLDDICKKCSLKIDNFVLKLIKQEKKK